MSGAADSGRDEPDGEPAAEEDGEGKAGEEGVERGVRGGGVHGGGPRCDPTMKAQLSLQSKQKESYAFIFLDIRENAW
jgi:hypothetical protein